MRTIIFLSTLVMMALASCTPGSVTLDTATITVSPLLKSTSTVTPILKPSVTMTPTASETPSPTAEPSANVTKVSPNGEYIAYVYFYWNEEQTVAIKDKNGKLIWQIPFQGGSPHGDPRAIMEIYGWSKDSSQLYFCYSWGSDGGDPPTQVSCYGLQQLDIKTGKVISAARSRDESLLAYINCGDEACIIHVQNISTGFDKTASVVFESNEQLAKIPYIDWSFDDTGLIFQLQDQNRMIKTIYLNILTMKYKVIKKYPSPKISGWADYQEWADYQGWADENVLEFLESGSEGLNVIQVDIRNNETTVIGTPTPTPAN